MGKSIAVVWTWESGVSATDHDGSVYETAVFGGAVPLWTVVAPGLDVSSVDGLSNWVRSVECAPGCDVVFGVCEWPDDTEYFSTHVEVVWSE